MPGHYPGTHVPFAEDSFTPELYQQFLDGPGHPVVADAAYRYRVVGNLMLGAASTVRDAAARLREGYDGAAAEAVQAHLGRLAAAGEAGEAQAQFAHSALADQTGHVSAVQNDLRSTGGVGGYPRDLGLPYDPGAAPRAQIVHAANRYQGNTNHVLDEVFAPFEPPSTPAIGPAGAVPGGGSTGGPAGAGGALGGLGGGLGAGVGGAGTNPAATLPSGASPTAPGGALPPPAGAPGVPPAVTGSGVPPVAALPPSGRSGDPRPPANPSRTDSTRGLPGTGPARPGGSQTWQPGRSGLPSPGVPGGPYRGGAATGGPYRGGAATGESRPGGSGAGPGRGPLVENQRPAAGGPGSASPAGARQPGAGHVPLGAGAGGVGVGQDDRHARPPWLLQDDPDAIWFAGLPAYVEPVIRGNGHS
ncbi:MAG: hypothetical protein ACT4RN_07760 [Pseudonocardia sp.]